MTYVSQNEKDAMANILSAWNSVPDTAMHSAPLQENYSAFDTGQFVDPITGQTLAVDPSSFGDDSYMPGDYGAPSRRSASVFVTSESKDDMADIMRRFSDAGGSTVAETLATGLNNVAQTMYENSTAMPDLRRAMGTERTPTGARFGNWEITVVNEKTKRYDISDVSSGVLLAKELYLYEAAEAIVNLLNDGRTINHPDVQRVLALEVEYASSIDNAVHFKAACDRALIRGDDFKLDVAKARFSEARNRALSAKKTLKEHLRRR